MAPSGPPATWPGPGPPWPPWSPLGTTGPGPGGTAWGLPAGLCTQRLRGLEPPHSWGAGCPAASARLCWLGTMWPHPLCLGSGRRTAAGICQGPSESWGRGGTPGSSRCGVGRSLVLLRSLQEVLLHVGRLLTLPGARPGQPHCYLRVAGPGGLCEPGPKSWSWPGMAELPKQGLVPEVPAGQLPRTQDKMEAGLGWGWGQSWDCVGWALRGGPGLVLQPLKGQCSEPAAGSAPTLVGVAQENSPFLPRVFSPRVCVSSLGAREATAGPWFPPCALRGQHP